MKRTDQQANESFREQYRRQMERLRLLLTKYGLVLIYRPALDIASWRSFNPMVEYCTGRKVSFPDYLAFERAS
jgi:hypothetical protein